MVGASIGWYRREDTLIQPKIDGSLVVLEVREQPGTQRRLDMLFKWEQGVACGHAS